jgi:hypothetical protein
VREPLFKIGFVPARDFKTSALKYKPDTLPIELDCLVLMFQKTANLSVVSLDYEA